MNRGHVSHDRPANHDVMKVSDDEISVMHMHIHAQRRQKQAGQSAHGEKANETACVKHGSMKRDRAFIEGGGPVEDFDRRRNRDHVAEK